MPISRENLNIDKGDEAFWVSSLLLIPLETDERASLYLFQLLYLLMVAFALSSWYFYISFVILVFYISIPTFFSFFDAFQLVEIAVGLD